MGRVRDKVSDRAREGRASLEGTDYSVRRMGSEYIRYCILGMLNTVTFWLAYELLYWLDLTNGVVRAPVAWAPAFFLSSVQAHAVHRWLTFRSKADYTESLVWAMAIYTMLLVISTASEFVMVEVWELHHRAAWVVNTCAFGFANFVALRVLAFPPEWDAPEDE